MSRTSSDKIVVLALTSLGVLGLVFTVATFPGERLNDILWSAPFTLSIDEKGKPDRTSLHELLVAGEPDLIARKPKSLWSNRLVLPGLDVIDRAKFDSEAKIAALPETVSLRARRLEGAMLIGANTKSLTHGAGSLAGIGMIHGGDHPSGGRHGCCRPAPL